MCLTVNRGATFKVAQEDITVYKSGVIYGDEYVSKYRGYSYKKGDVQMKVTLTTYPLGHTIERQIYEGYHSYTSLREADLHTKYECEKLGVFTIPKGSMYIEGTFAGTKSYVSETLIFNGEYKKKSLLKRFLQLFKK